ncbi:hypothetical protein [Synechococcus phage S-B68]|nr:hypothetical protein [Synechococcus phage S-B68]
MTYNSKALAQMADWQDDIQRLVDFYSNNSYYCLAIRLKRRRQRIADFVDLKRMAMECRHLYSVLSDPNKDC